MAQQIFLIGDDGSLRPMIETPYPSEELFQDYSRSTRSFSVEIKCPRGVRGGGS